MMGDADINTYHLTRLQAELEQERESREMLKESVCDLRRTLADLEERVNSVDGEGNEWRTRYETQQELNRQLERQIGDVQERLESLRGNPMDRLASVRMYDGMTVDNLTHFWVKTSAVRNALRHRLKLLSTEKSSLQSHLLECRLKIKQEGKAYQKAYDERRAYLSEIAKVSSAFDWTRKQQLTHIQKPTHNTGKGAPVPQKHDIKAKRGAISTFPQTRLPRLKR